MVDGLSQLDFHGLVITGGTAHVRWSKSPFFIAVAGAHILVVVVPRAGVERVSFSDVASAVPPVIGPIDLP